LIILIVSDLHNNRLLEVAPEDELKKIDFAITVGDILHYEDFKELNIPAIGVLGNHDLLEKFNRDKILIDCHKKVREFKGMTFMGIEGVFCGKKRFLNANRRRWYHQLEDDVAKYLDNAPQVTFFLTHYRAKDIFDRYKEGSPSFRRYIEEKQPSFYISGHTLHDDKYTQIGNTLCINPHGKKWKYVILKLPEIKLEFK